MKSEKSTPVYTAPALTKGLEILDYLASTSGEATQTEIARALGRKPSELFRLLQVLEQEGYLARGNANTYRVGLRLFRLAVAPDPLKILISTAHEPMREYVRLTGQECHLSILDRGQLIVLADEVADSPICLRVRRGSAHDPRATTSGRLLLACLDEEAREQHCKLAKEHFPEGNSPSIKSISTNTDGHVLSIEEANHVLPGVRNFAIYIPNGAACPTAVITTTCLLPKGKPVKLAWRKALQDCAVKVRGE
jgi:DNA-binding IclR family transcriptional regulator